MEQFTNPYLESPQCIAPNSIYQQSMNPDSAIYGAVYSGVPVYEMMCRNVAVMRRKEDSYLNATQILKVAGIDKGRRTKILEKEIINGEHEKVQGGYGKYQGTWGCQLAAQFNVDTQLSPILTFVPPSPGTVDSTPSKEQVLASTNKTNSTIGKHKRSDKNSPEIIPTRKGRKKSTLNVENTENHFVYPTKSQELIQGGGERHRATLMAMFLSDSPMTIPDILVSPHPPIDLDVNIVIDDQGHTALHWAAALARVDILRLLIAKGGDILRVNFNNESALIRAVLVTNNFDSQTFPELLNLLAPSLHILDSSRRSVLHHIALVASNKGRGAATRYYMECILEYIAKNGGNFSSLIDAVDIHGDTALNLSARIGSRNLVDQLLDVGANSEIENLAGLNPSSFGFSRFDNSVQAASSSRSSDLIHYTTEPSTQIKDGYSLSTRVVFPSISIGGENDSNREISRQGGNPSPLEETQIQLRKLTKELVEHRKQNDLLREQNRRIPELEEKIRVLSEGLEEEISRRSTLPLVVGEGQLPSDVEENQHDGSLESLLNEITVLKAALVNKEALEQELRRELVSVKSCTDSQEFKCKQIIAACVGVPIENVEALLDPLFRAIESDDPVDIMDMNQMTSFMNRVKGHDKDLMKKRYLSLRQAFNLKFGRNPDFYARSPGRVNLIGEHIDYSLYSVLPMAIDRDVVMAIATIDSDRPGVSIANVNPKYQDCHFDHDPQNIVDIDPSVHEWSNYFKCGYKGVFEKLKFQANKRIIILMDGTVPLGGGLSSSSAFVCCSALSTMAANQKILTMGELTQIAISSERYAGVQSGGMDQSISIMASSGSPLVIHFYPELQAERVYFANITPVFVIANTLVTAEKHLTAPTNYNLRVVEVRLAAAILAKKLKLDHDIQLITLREVQEYFTKSRGLESQDTVDILFSLLEQVEKCFNEEGYTREEIAAELEISVQKMEEKYIGDIVIRADVFQLYKRAKHVFSEAQRVFMFKKVSESASSESAFKELGDLMNSSQASCRDLFNCSCPALDEMTSLALKLGAYGSRLTGAGWGGCTVSLLSASQVEDFIFSMKKEYYQKNMPHLKLDDHMFDEYIFASNPGSGCGIILNCE